jgi:hypothetical protein
MAEEIKAKKVPYVCLSTDVERDEYNKLSLTEWNVDSTDTLYIVECSDGGTVQHGLNMNSTKWTPQMKDKIYFMKGCTVPRVKLKDLSVKYKIRTTTDLDKATVVVGSDAAGNKLFKHEWIRRVSGEVFEATIKALQEVSEEQIDGYYLNRLNHLKESFDDEWPEYVYVDWDTKNLCNPLNQNHTVELQQAQLKHLGCTNEDQFKKKYGHINSYRSNYVQTISEDNLELWEQYKTKHIIEQGALLEVVNGDEATTIDLDTYQNLRNMFNSSDTDNHVLAMEIMANCNYKDSILFLTMLFFHHSYQIGNCRSRNHVNFKSLKNYLGEVWSHVDGIFNTLSQHNALTAENIEFVVEDQKKYFENNGHSDYLVPQRYVLKREHALNHGVNYVKEIFAYEDDLPTEDEVTEEVPVEDTVDEVTVSEPDTVELTSGEDPETEEAEVETEEEVTETLIAEQKEEKNEEEFDWF